MKIDKIYKLLIFLIAILMLLFYSVLKITDEDRSLTRYLKTSKTTYAMRGEILTNDRDEKGKRTPFHIAKSQFLYKAIIDTRYFDMDKKELFVSLFSIYSGIKKDKIHKKLNGQKKLGRIILSYNIPSHTAVQLKHISKKLNHFKVFRPKDKHSSFYSGLDIVGSGEKRIYPYKAI